MRVNIEHLHELVPIECDEIDIIKLFKQGNISVYTNDDTTTYIDPKNKVIIELFDNENNNTNLWIYYNVKVYKKRKLMTYNMIRFAAIGKDHNKIISSVNEFDVPNSNDVVLYEEPYGVYTMLRYDTVDFI